MSDSFLFLDKELLFPFMSTPCSDTTTQQMEASVGMLSQLLGRDSLTNIICYGTYAGSTNSIFVSMLGIFNTTLLSLFVVIFAIVVIVSVLGGAHEGSMDGKGMGFSSGMAVRVVFAPMLVVPIQSGLCLIQFLLLYAVLIGVQIATTVWQQTLSDITLGDTTSLPSSFVQDYRDAMKKALVYSSVDYISRSIKYTYKDKDAKKDPVKREGAGFTMIVVQPNPMDCIGGGGSCPTPFTPFQSVVQIVNDTSSADPGQSTLSGQVLNVNELSNDIPYFFCLLYQKINGNLNTATRGTFKQWEKSYKFSDPGAATGSPSWEYATSGDFYNNIRDFVQALYVKTAGELNCYGDTTQGVQFNVAHIGKDSDVDPFGFDYTITVQIPSTTSPKVFNLWGKTASTDGTHLKWIQFQDFSEYYIAIDSMTLSPTDCFSVIGAESSSVDITADGGILFNTCDGNSSPEAQGNSPSGTQEGQQDFFDFNYGGEEGETFNPAKCFTDSVQAPTEILLNPQQSGCLELYMMDPGYKSTSPIGGYKIGNALNVDAGVNYCNKKGVECDISPLINRLVKDFLMQDDKGYPIDGSAGFCPTDPNDAKWYKQAGSTGSGWYVSSLKFSGAYFQGTGPNPDLGCYNLDTGSSTSICNSSPCLAYDYWPSDPSTIIDKTCIDGKGLAIPNCITKCDCIKKVNNQAKCSTSGSSTGTNTCSQVPGVRFDTSWWYAGSSYLAVQQYLAASYKMLVNKADDIKVSNSSKVYAPVIQLQAPPMQTTNALITMIMPTDTFNDDHEFPFYYEIFQSGGSTIIPVADTQKRKEMAFNLILDTKDWLRFLDRLYLNGCQLISGDYVCSNFWFYDALPCSTAVAVNSTIPKSSTDTPGTTHICTFDNLYKNIYADYFYNTSYDDTMPMPTYAGVLKAIKEAAVDSLCGTKSVSASAIDASTAILTGPTSSTSGPYGKETWYPPATDLDSCAVYKSLQKKSIVNDKLIQIPIMALISLLDKIDPSGVDTDSSGTTPVITNKPITSGVGSPWLARKKQVNNLYYLLVANGYIVSGDTPNTPGNLAHQETMSSAKNLINNVFQGLFGGGGG